MAVILSPNLKLRIDTNLTANAKYNLYQIDTLGLTYVIDSSGDVRIRAAQNIILQPEDTSVGGTGGGVVSLASQAAPADSIELWASNILVGGSLTLQDEATGSTGSLALAYNSDASGSPDNNPYKLVIDTNGLDRELVLGADLYINGPTASGLTLNLTGSSTLTLPVTGTLTTRAGAETFTNKTIDANLNTILNIPGSAISPSAAIPYSKLLLTNALVNTDINSAAGIVYTKLTLSNSIVNSDIRASAAISYSKLNLSGSVTNSDVSSTASISYGKLNLIGQLQNTDIITNADISRSKLGPGTAGWVVINSGDGHFSEEPILNQVRGGTGVSGGAVFPASGIVATDVNTLTFSNKSISGSANTFSNIPYSAVNLANQLKNSDISSTAGIIYSKLNLSNSIVNTDIRTNAAIAGTKITPNFGTQQIVTSGGIRLIQGLFRTDIFTNPSQAVDYNLTLPIDAGAFGQVLITDGAGTLSWSTISGTGTVTSVGFSAPNSLFSVTGAPITTSGTIALALTTQAANTVFSGPSTGAASQPTFRSLVVSDLPTAIPATAIGGGSVDNTEFSYLDGVTSNLQTQLNTLSSNTARNRTATWITADGPTKTVTHNWGTFNIRCEILDIDNNYSTINVDSISRPTNNTVVLTASSTPSGSGWRILLTEVIN